MAWRVAKSLETLRDQINKEWPNRSKASDGTIGDEKHATTDSDHNPWVKDGATGVVTALDITHDPEHGCDCGKIVAQLVQSRDPRIKYVIWNGGMWRAYDKPGIPAWSRAPYTGSNPHSKHFHLSVQPQKYHYDSTAPWTIKKPEKATHTPPWEIVVNRKVVATGRLTSPKFILALRKALVANGKATVREKP